MAARRALVVFIVLLAATGLGALLIQVLSPGGWTLPKIAMMAAFTGAAPWTGLCMANGLIGFVILVMFRNPVQRGVSGRRYRGRDAAVAAHGNRNDGARGGYAPRAAAVATHAARPGPLGGR